MQGLTSQLASSPKRLPERVVNFLLSDFIEQSQCFCELPL